MAKTDFAVDCNLSDHPSKHYGVYGILHHWQKTLWQIKLVLIGHRCKAVLILILFLKYPVFVHSCSINPWDFVEQCFFIKNITITLLKLKQICRKLYDNNIIKPEFENGVFKIFQQYFVFDCSTTTAEQINKNISVHLRSHSAGWWAE